MADGPVRSLGKWFCKALHDKPAIEKTREKFESWMTRIENCGLPGRFKAWLYHHGVLPRLLWLLQVYSVPISIVEKLERNVSRFLRRWLGLPRSLNSAALYGSSNAIQLPFRGLVEEFMVSRTREIDQYKNSRDPKVLTGRKWSAEKELAIAEGNLRVKSIVGSVAKCRAGLGLIPTYCPGKVTIKEGQKLIQVEVSAWMEEKRMTKMVGYGQQGAWTKWDKTDRHKVSWSEFWQTDFCRTKFLVKIVYDQLPNPANLHVWGKTETPNCPLCPEKGSLQHILSSCKTALAKGRYRRRHDKVLEATASIITEAFQRSKFVPGKRVIKFVKPETIANEKPKVALSILSPASDWLIRVDLG